MSKRVTEISRLLKGATPDELKEISARVDGERTLGREEQQIRSGDGQDWLLLAILDELRARGQGGTIPPMAVLKKRSIFVPYASVAGEMRDWLENASPDMKKNERLLLAAIAAEALATFVRDGRKREGVTLTTMLRNVVRLPEALEAAFPGYIESGLLRHVVRARARSPRATLG